MYVSVCVVRRVRVADRLTNSGAECSKGHAAGRSRARGGGHGAAAGRCPTADDSDSEDVLELDTFFITVFKMHFY